MWITIIVGVVAFVIGLAVGFIWTNIAITNVIGRRMGW
jgi:uncharacterized protein YneF (UPF0154 family)